MLVFFKGLLRTRYNGPRVMHSHVQAPGKLVQCYVLDPVHYVQSRYTQEKK